MTRILQSFRALRRHPRFATLAVVSLAVAIALNTTMYSVMDALINPRVAMREPERLFTLQYFGDYRRRVPDEVKAEVLRGLTSFDGMARSMLRRSGENLAERGNRIRNARVLTVSPNYFALLGNRAAAGRLLSVADSAVPTRPVVLGARMWNALFPETGFFPGAAIILDAEPRPVVGILDYESDFPGAYTDVWELVDPADVTARVSIPNLVRLRDGVTLDAAHAELHNAQLHLAELAGEGPTETRFYTRPVVGEPFKLLGFHYALVAAVVAVLLVACVNIANLQLARGVSRAREMATRAAVGASRADLVSQLVLESSWLALGGLALGLLLTLWGMKLVSSSVPATLAEYIVRPHTSWRVSAFAGIAAVACLAIVGLFPAIQMSRVDINELLKSGAGTGVSRRAMRQYGTLVVVQVSLALALMVGATLLLRAASGLYRIEYNPMFDRIAQAWLRITPSRPDDRRRLGDVSVEVLQRARAIPLAADAATEYWIIPDQRILSLADDDGGTARELRTGQRGFPVVSSGYVRTYGLKIRKGRDFQEGEFAEAVVIVDEPTARFLWPGQNPIGKLLKLGSISRSRRPWLRVVGVSEELNTWGFLNPEVAKSRAHAYLGSILILNGADTTTVGAGGSALSVIVRARSNLQRVPVLLRKELSNFIPGVRVIRAQRLFSMQMLDAARERLTFVTTLFGVFAILALAVASLGVYAVVSHAVSQRTRDFGVRVALGADHRTLRREVFRHGNILTLSGIAIGLVLAARTVGLLQGFLGSEEARYDSWLYAIAAVVLLTVSCLATYVPARRAMRINPVEALHND